MNAECSIRVVTRPYAGDRWPVPALVIVILVVTVVSVRLGYLPPVWLAPAVGVGLAVVRASLSARQAVPQIGG